MRGHKRKRSARTWELQAYDRVGKRYVYQTIEAKSAREANKLLNAFVTEVDAGRASQAPARLTLKTVCDEWLDAKRFKSHKTREQYEWSVSHIERELGRMEIRAVGLRDIEKAYRRLEARLAPRSIRHVHNALCQVLDYARRARYIAHNPAEHVQGLPEVNAWTIDAPTAQEVNAFLTGVREFAGEVWWAFTVLVASTGMRRGEACGLVWVDVDLDAREVRIERAAIDIQGKLIKAHPKTRGSIRTIKIDPLVADILADRLVRLEKARAEADATEPVAECYVFSPDPFGEDFSRRTRRRRCSDVSAPASRTTGCGTTGSVTSRRRRRFSGECRSPR